MPLLLHAVRQNRWLREPALPWLERNDVPADPVGDLKTSQNRLSVWVVADDRSNIERIVRAIAIGRDKVDHMGYVLFDSTLLSDIGTTAEPIPGNTLDDGANDWHRDLVDLSGNKLIALTRMILTRGETGNVLKKRLKELILDGIEQKQLPENLRSKFDPRTS